MGENDDGSFPGIASERKNIFFSYSRDPTQTLVLKIKDDLRKRGHNVWIDQESVQGGEAWRAAIMGGIHSSQIALAFLSKRAVQVSKVCREEIALAMQHLGCVTPVDIEDVGNDCVAIVRHVNVIEFNFESASDGEDPALSEAYYRQKFTELLTAIEDVAAKREKKTSFLREVLEPESFEASFTQNIVLDEVYENGTAPFIGREWLFEEFQRWRKTPDQRIFWLNAPPGFGKSAFSIELYKRERGHIAAHWLCGRGSDRLRDPKRFVFTIAYQIASDCRWDAYREALTQTLKRNFKAVPAKKDDASSEDRMTNSEDDAAGVRKCLHELSAVDAFRLLLEEPLASSLTPDDEWKPLVIVVDGLDEAVAPDGSNPLVELLADRLNRLPMLLKLFATSRPETSVVDRFGRFQPYPIADKKDENRADLVAYCRRELERRAISIAEGLSGETVIDLLVKKSEGVLLYLRMFFETVDGRIGALSEIDRLPSGMNSFYKEYFDRIYRSADASKQAAVRSVIAALVAAREPLSRHELSQICGLHERDDVQFALDHLRSGISDSLRWQSDQSEQMTSPIKTFAFAHKSIKDWLCSVEAGRYGVTLEDGQEPIRRYCERVLHEGHGERWYARRNAVAHFLSSKKFWPKVEAYLTDLDFIAERFESKEATLLLRDLDEAVERFSKADEIENASEKSLREWSQEVLAFPSHAITREGASIPRPPGAHALASERQIKELRQATPTRFDRLKELQGFLHMQVGAIERTSSNRRKSFIAQQMSNLSRSGHLHGMAARHLRDCKQPLLRRAGSGGSDRYNGQDPCIGTFRLESRAEALAWRPETDCLAIGHENGDLRIFRPGQLHSDTVLRCEPDKKTGRRRKALCVDISWDRKKAVVGHSDGTVRVWDLENQTCCWSFKHNHEVVDADEAENPEVEGSKRKKRDLHARISPDGRRLLTAGDDGKVCIWDISTCEARWASPESDFAHGLAWSADGRRVVYGRADGGIACWDEALQERFILPGDGSEVRDLVLSFDGGVCVTGQKNGKVAIWDMERRRCSSRLDADLVGPIYAVAITADGARFAAGGKDKRIRVWRSADQKLERVLFGSLFPVHCLAMHPLGHQIISGGRENFLRIWDLSNRNSLDVDASDGAEFKSLMRSSDRRFAIAYDEHGRFHKWRLADLKRVGELQKIGQGQAAEFFRAAPLPRSREICVVGVDKSIRIVDENDGRVKLQFPATVSGKKFAAASTLDEKTLIVSSGDRQSRISLWDKRRGVQLSSSAKPIGLVRALVVLPDGRRFVSVSEDRAIRFWSLGDPEPQSIIKDAHDSHIHWAACSPDGRLLATAGRDRVLSLWSTETQQRLWTDGGGHQGALFWVEFSASGQYLWSACWNGLVQIWDVGARRVLTSAWLPGVSRLMLFNRGRSAIIGTSIGHIDRFDASGLEDKPVIATALRSNKPFHGASALFTCNECGKQSSVSRKIFDRISQWESGTSDEGYNDPLLVTSCKKCGSKTRMNPFFASPGIECP